MIHIPSPDCSYVVLNFWPNLSLVVLIKLFLYACKLFFFFFLSERLILVADAETECS